MKKKIIKYMENDIDFSPSFESIKDKINIQNIVIREDEKKKSNFFQSRKFKFGFAIALVFTTISTGLVAKKVYENKHKVKYYIEQVNNSYDSYEDFAADYNYYKVYSIEKEIKIFAIDLEDDGKYTYTLNFAKKTNLKTNEFSAKNISLYLNVIYNENSYVEIKYRPIVDNYNYLEWEIGLQSGINSYNLLNENNEYALIMHTYNISSTKISLLQDYLIEQIKK